MAAPSNAVTKPSRGSRRWLQASLRFVLTAFTLLAIGLGWYSNRALRQQRAVASIIAQGGRVRYASEPRVGNASRPDPPFISKFIGIDFVDSVIDIDLLGPEFDDEDLRLLDDLPHVQSLQLYQTKITGRGFKAVARLQQLEDLMANYSPLDDQALGHLRNKGIRKVFIENAKITDAGLVELATCKRLQTLWITHCRISDAGILPFKQLTTLENVNLSNTSITDSALAVFADHPTLEELKCRHTAVTDQGLAQLGKPPKLDYLAVENTLVTPEGCARLKALYGSKLKIAGPRLPPR